MKNSADRYGLVTKLLHWTVFLLILNQFVVATAMLNTPQGETTGGFSQARQRRLHGRRTALADEFLYRPERRHRKHHAVIEVRVPQGRDALDLVEHRAP